MKNITYFMVDTNVGGACRTVGRDGHCVSTAVVTLYSIEQPDFNLAGRMTPGKVTDFDLKLGHMTKWDINNGLQIMGAEHLAHVVQNVSQAPNLQRDIFPVVNRSTGIVNFKTDLSEDEIELLCDATKRFYDFDEAPTPKWASPEKHAQAIRKEKLKLLAAHSEFALCGKEGRDDAMTDPQDMERLTKFIRAVHSVTSGYRPLVVAPVGSVRSAFGATGHDVAIVHAPQFDREEALKIQFKPGIEG